ncbi:sterigmatocystin biosynthesis polyketide synthase [Tolypocladium capitatum]|uniref:Sterigmatocystin biosynthesis polyketide synthase n=1 Tax=Tolypocladium capitatum TaxID=45235 RepID=A0A2K3Q947_9HYPO|nr:sterigmatocystin biosynthesis polyketide synthase [Tolypocladium capitatum]
MSTMRDDLDVYYSPGMRKPSCLIPNGSLTSPIGTLRAFLNGRLSNCFGFKGPSMRYTMPKALQSGDCTAALAGGVNIISIPDYLGLSHAHFLSPTGQCKPFDASADGYFRGEGCGLVMLKKLSNAIKDRDHVYGIVRGVGVNQCGTAKSITHPDLGTQAALFTQIISMLWRLTEPVLKLDFAEVPASRWSSKIATTNTRCTSALGNIGHSEAVSGAASLIAASHDGEEYNAFTGTIYDSSPAAQNDAKQKHGDTDFGASLDGDRFPTVKG